MDSDLLGGLCTLIFFNRKYDSLTLKTDDYGFKQQYHFTNQNAIISKNGINVETNRLRTGIINYPAGSEYLTMSAQREGAGEAYITYSMNRPISGINVDISLWSNSERMSILDSSIDLEISIGGNWVNAKNFFPDEDLSKNRNVPNNFTIMFNNPIYSFRFKVTSIAFGTTNKGRVVIDDMVIFYD